MATLLATRRLTTRRPTKRSPIFKPALHVFGLLAMFYSGWIFAGQEAFLLPDFLVNAMASFGF